MSELKTYHSLFEKGMKFVEGRVTLDGHELPKPSFFEKRRLLKAVRILEQAADHEPPYGAASLMVAKIYDRLGQAEESLRWMRKAQSVAPTSIIVALELGGLLSRQGLYTEAIAVLIEATRLDANDPRVHSNLGVAMLLSGNIEGSIQAFERLNQLEPDYRMNRRLLNLAVQVKDGHKTRPTTDGELLRSL